LTRNLQNASRAFSALMIACTFAKAAARLETRTRGSPTMVL